MIRKISVTVFVALLFIGCAAKKTPKPVPSSTNIRFGEKILTLNAVSDKKDSKQRIQYAFGLVERGRFLEAAESFIKISEDFSSVEHRLEYECSLTATALYLRVGKLEAAEEAMKRAAGFYDGHVRTTRENGLWYIYQLLKKSETKGREIEVPMKLKNFLK